ncbi:MAG: hypothetical protein E6Y81_06100 [Cutibacterium avidum]|uniref:Uncharacterized protein n=1 Tax=Cutibacterium avidum TaxID=33010 RepID=A0A3E2DM56_9ACTN|nr:hypothetical protein [Cutibacterium avidum]MBS5744492.1 hypothetical protein [Propionibacterium sp.]MCO6681612.1 hypothetical protein [Cutibacterium avidum]MDK7359753.1 hypothetical protein [Cutibacterium avidum]MDK7373590.1 hypothetical protein [Cutibacterium avidum]MDU2071936.1 hypothetical protein [Cutibacterium avidum]
MEFARGKAQSDGEEKLGMVGCHRRDRTDGHGVHLDPEARRSGLITCRDDIISGTGYVPRPRSA